LNGFSDVCDRPKNVFLLLSKHLGKILKHRLFGLLIVGGLQVLAPEIFVSFCHHLLNNLADVRSILVLKDIEKLPQQARKKVKRLQKY